jgi:hypothetical protein
MNRYEVALTSNTDKYNTFTWAETLEGAKQRVAETMEEQGTWEGWTAKVSE